jgi:hypothetical protein
MPYWWNDKYGRDKVCAITMSRLRPGKNKDGNKYSVFLRCGHGFVRNAIINVVKSNINSKPKCPLCRKFFNPIDL